ncbi:MAG: hypothetical protein IKR64_04435 [Treponema sp.]|nr:hypothetical protein [Treponema sp.]
MCWKCKKEISIEKPVRGDECPLCHADLHVCRACDFYESGAHNDCRESSADMVTDKERSNFCDYFRVALRQAQGPQGAQGSQGAQSGNKAAAARNAFNALFGD